MITRANSGFTKHDEPYVQLSLEHGGAVILKAYISPDGRKIRIFVPELSDFTQTRIWPEVHMIDFDRKPKGDSK